MNPHGAKMDFTDDMQELSGFGGGYEAACRRMMFASLAYLRGNDIVLDPDLPLPGHVREGMETAALSVEPDCSGAMMGAAVSHAASIHVRGWEAYAASSRARKAWDDAEAPARERELQQRRATHAARAAAALAEQEAWGTRCETEWEAQEEATSVHWLHLRHGVGGWEAGLGSHIRDVAAEFLRLSRGLNRKMPFTFNGQVLYAAPEDESADVVAARYSL